MSKYIDELTELICDTVRTVFPNASLDDGYDVADDVIAKLTTIEVSEDCISREELLKDFGLSEKSRKYGGDHSGYQTLMLYEIQGIIKNAPSVVPTAYNLSAVEDCISREWLKSFEYINKGDFNSVETIREWIDNAPSVVPTTEQSSMVGEWIDYYYPYFEVTGIACSVCGKDVPYWSRHNEIPNYCPNCGARMKGAE